MKYQSFGGFILRLPAFSFSFFKKIQEMELGELIELFNDPYIQESIYFASPILFKKLKNYKSESLKENEKKRILFSFFKYLIRLSTKPTPFGIFAGSSYSNNIGNKTEYKINDKKNNIKTTKLTIQTIELIINKIEDSLIFPNKLIYYTNNTLYKLPYGDYRYIRINYNIAGKSFEIVNLQSSEFIDKVILLANNGITSENLYNSLLQDPEITEKEAISFIKSLISSQILKSDLKPKLVTNDNLDDLLKLIKEYDIENFTNNKLLINEIKEIEGIITKNLDLPSLFRIEDKLKDLLIPFNEKKFHADLLINPEINTLNNDVINSVLPRAFSVLSRLVEANTTPIASFKKNMIDRYGNKEIRLVEALDPIIGIGYNENRNLNRKEPLFEGIEWDENNSDLTFRSIDQFLMKKIKSESLINKIEYQLTEQDLSELPERTDLLPETFSAFISVLDNKNEKYLFNAASSYTAAAHISRFSHLDKGIDGLLKSIFEYESNIADGSIVAEVIHLPTQEIGNIILRTSTRENEISYLSKQTKTNSNNIDINDLFVSIDSKNNLILKSKRLNKRIIPKVSIGYNYVMTQFPIFRFLCDLQSGKDYLTGFEFTWGDCFRFFSFLPRISYQNIIFSPARWRFADEELAFLQKILNDDINSASIKKFLKKHNIPRYIYFIENGSDLMLDLESKNSLNLFKSLIKGKKEINLKESFFSDTNSMIQQYDYLNEYIIPIKKCK